MRLTPNLSPHPSLQVRLQRLQPGFLSLQLKPLWNSIHTPVPHAASLGHLTHTMSHTGLILFPVLLIFLGSDTMQWSPPPLSHRAQLSCLLLDTFFHLPSPIFQQVLMSL